MKRRNKQKIATETTEKCKSLKQKGVVLIICMIFLCIFTTLAVAMATMTNSSLQAVNKQHKVNCALSAAQSALECGKFIVNDTLGHLRSTNSNLVTQAQAEETWNSLCSRMQQLQIGGQAVSGPGPFSDSGRSGTEIISQNIGFGSPGASFRIRFYRYDSDPLAVRLEGIGLDGPVTRTAGINMKITKDAEVLQYAIASRGRMWLTGESTIHGDVFNSWDRPEISPFNMTSDSAVLGTINTVIEKKYFDADDPDYAGYHLETLDENGNPMFDEDGNRIYSDDDEVKGYHEGINYGQPTMDMPGMDISHYNTDEYRNITSTENGGSGDIPESSVIQTEYFPHSAGDYSLPRDGTPGHTSNRRLNRYVYENDTFTDTRLPDNRNALFKNCTFEGVTYIDCYKNSGTYYNNVRFDNCAFNGVIVSDVPQTFKWQHNCLYFTGAANFDNNSSIQEATVLAPHFNVNLGNTNPEQSDNNVLTGAIVGGIVDVRGNAQIYGTIISMCDTSQWSSGYVTNIGATLNDGGSETTDAGDIGVISITPEEDMMLPSGITSPIIIKPLQDTYSEGV